MSQKYAKIVFILLVMSDDCPNVLKFYSYCIFKLLLYMYVVHNYNYNKLLLYLLIKYC